MRKIGPATCVLSLALMGLAPLGGCRSKADAPKAPVAEPAKEQVKLVRAEAKAPGRRAAVGVEGTWKIEVKNPDGSVAHRRQFKNNITLTGIEMLNGLFTGSRTFGGWSILATQSPGSPTGPEEDICDPTVNLQGEDCISRNLVVSVLPETGGLELNGSYLVSTDGDIIIVGTRVTHCDGTTTPADCMNGGPAVSSTYFTMHRFDMNGELNVPVTAGQQVQIAVGLRWVTG